MHFLFATGTWPLIEGNRIRLKQPLLFFEKGGQTTMPKESKFQAEVIKEIKSRLPGCIVLKNDAGYLQGIPDLLILHQKKWGALEVKRSSKASRQPNQEHYVSELNKMSFASFISPENKGEILNELQSALSPRRTTRVSQRKQVSLD